MKTKKFQSKGLYAPVVGFSENDYSTSLQLDGEQWKTLQVLGRPYEISNYGRVKSKELTERFTEHLTNAQVGRRLRCVARFERGDISPQHVAELRKDAAVGVAYNFITDRLERRAK